jgi:hypothetical protein
MQQTPNFEKLYSAFEATMLEDAYQAISACDLWDWMRSYSPEEGKGFMFSNHPNLDRINKEMKYGGHSGGSYGWTMRTMQTIAKLGWEEFVKQVMERRRKEDEEICAAPKAPACPCRHAKGYTHGWCGVAGGGVPGCDH